MRIGLAVVVLGAALVVGLALAGRERAGVRAPARRELVPAPLPEAPAEERAPIRIEEPAPRGPESVAGKVEPCRPPEEPFRVRFDGPVPDRRLDMEADLLLLTDERRVALDRLVLENDAREVRVVPLDEFLTHVRLRTGIPSARSDPVRLREGAAVVLPAAGSATAVELLDALPGLAWTVRWGTLLVHPAGTEPPFPGQLTIYPVGDLDEVEPDGLRRAVAPWSWDAYGDRVKVHAHPGGPLVVTTIPPIQDELALHFARRRREASAAAGIAFPSEEEWDAPALTGSGRSR